MPVPSEPSPPPSAKASPQASSSLDLDGQVTLKSVGTGSLVFGRYELIRILGRGGMGIVWLAADTKLEREVALKFLPDLIGTDAVALGELKSETRRGLELAHPNIVRIYDFLDDTESAAISMEFIDGKTLSEARLNQPHKVFSTEILAPWVSQICDALTYAHDQKKIIHRDLKPANFMLGKDQIIKIADFGIARSVTDTMSRLTGHHGGTSGTLMYMSPQQALGERPSATDDIYSLGATLYELLTGKPPFYTGDITLQITTKIPPSLQSRREELGVIAEDRIPEVWEQTIAACLDKDPSKRPQSSRELAQRLELFRWSDSGALPPSKSLLSQGSDGGTPSDEVTEFQTSGGPHLSPDLPKKQKRLILTCVGAVVLVVASLFVFSQAFAPPPTATVTLKTRPEGASFVLAGKKYKTPATIENLPPGPYMVEFELAGHQPLEASFELDGGETEDLTAFQLQPSFGKLSLTSSPTEAKFTLRSTTFPEFQPVEGATPASFDLLPGSYRIEWQSGEDSGVITQEIEADKFYSQNFSIHHRTIVPPKAEIVEPAPDEPEEPSPTPTLPLLDDLTPLKEIVPPDKLKSFPRNLSDAGPPALSTETQPHSYETPWSIAEIFEFSPYATYSENGRRYILSLAQQALKKAQHYNSTVDGRPGSGTHLAIQAFQSNNELEPTGLLDQSTLEALSLSELKDSKEWASNIKPVMRTRRTKPKEEPTGWWSRNVGGFVKKIFNK